MSDMGDVGPTIGSGFYVPKSIKRNRRTKATIEGIRGHIDDILSKDNPQTVRQVFYALTVRGAIAKLEAQYHGTVVRLLTEMREEGRIPFGSIADNTRWMRKPTTFTSPGEFLHAGAQGYRHVCRARRDTRPSITRSRSWLH